MIQKLILMIVSMSIIFGTDADDVVATVDAIDKAWVEEKPDDVFENVPGTASFFNIFARQTRGIHAFLSSSIQNPKGVPA